MNNYMIAGLAAVSLTACQITPESLTKDGGSELSMPETIAFYSGKSSRWMNDAGSQYFQEDGTYLWRRDEGEVEQGSWSVNDAGDLCLLVPGWYNDEETCFDLWRKPDGNVVLFYPNGRIGTPKPMVEGDSVL